MEVGIGGVSGTAGADLPGASSGSRPPCPVDDDRITLMGLLVEAHAHLTRLLGVELEQACGIPLTWFDVLIRLARSPDEHLTMTQLAGEVSLTSGGITRLVDRITEAGYVERQNCPSDRRSMYVALTPSGWSKLHEAIAVHLDGLDRHLIDPLNVADQDALNVALRKLRGDGPVCGG
ncbi:MAG TPA: MarR family winged helix-turn-helix transcriptional regulator [Acidimicrobiales bacterium]|nr:MarR family winged helix-turn-helix transcriptional regulator [Acidimicrobiales bacterium]